MSWKDVPHPEQNATMLCYPDFDCLLTHNFMSAVQIQKIF